MADVIAIYMANKPAYPIFWIACMSIDVVRPPRHAKFGSMLTYNRSPHLSITI